MSLHSSKKIPQQEQLLRTDAPPNCAPYRRVHKASPREVEFTLSIYTKQSLTGPRQLPLTNSDIHTSLGVESILEFLFLLCGERQGEQKLT